jgi:Ice-binding-like
MRSKVPLFHSAVRSLTYQWSRYLRRPSKERTVNKNVKPSLSQVGATLLVLSLGAGCGSVGAQTPNDGGPNGGNGGNGGSGASGGSGGLTGDAGTDGGKTDGGKTGGTTGAAGVPVNLRTAGNYAILAESGISTVPPAVITGALGIYPMAASFITNFSLIADSTNVFSTSAQVTGKVYAADYAVPTPSNLLTAVGDMGLAFTDAAGRAPDVTELGAGSIGGMTLAPGVYRWGTAVLIPTDLTLNGSSTAVWIFQIAQTLTLSSAVRVHLTGGALAKNVFWQVAGSVELGTTSHLEGIVLSATMINLRTGASIAGRLLAQTAVTLDSSTVTQPAP